MVMVLILVSFDVHMQLTVVMAVRKAVSAATITFAATSMNLFFIVLFFYCHTDLHGSSQISYSFGITRSHLLTRPVGT